MSSNINHASIQTEKEYSFLHAHGLMPVSQEKCVCLKLKNCAVCKCLNAWRWHCSPQGAESHVITDYGSTGLGLMCILAPPFCATILLLTGTSSTTCCPTGGSHIVHAYSALLTNFFGLSHVSPFDSTTCHMLWKKLHSDRLLTWHSNTFTVTQHVIPVASQIHKNFLTLV